MSDVHIYQIYYNEETRQQLQEGFIPLDNMANEYPDWAEYWPIRQHYLNNTLNPNDWYGYFSPKFTAKTWLTSEKVFEFIDKFKDSDADIIIFPMHWLSTCYYQNVFEHGEDAHPGLYNITQQFLNQIGMKTVLKDLVMHSQNTVWCNYFVAKPSFWKRWHEIMDAFYQVTLNKKHESNAKTIYISECSAMKVFIMERIASLLMTIEPFKVVAYNTFDIPISGSIHLQDYSVELIRCNAYKMAYEKNGSEIYLMLFNQLRDWIVDTQQKKLKESAQS